MNAQLKTEVVNDPARFGLISPEKFPWESVAISQNVMGRTAVLWRCQKCAPEAIALGPRRTYQDLVDDMTPIKLPTPVKLTYFRVLPGPSYFLGQCPDCGTVYECEIQ